MLRHTLARLSKCRSGGLTTASNALRIHQGRHSAGIPARRPASTAAMSPVAASWVRPAVPGTLTADELEQFFEDGYVVKHDVLDVEADLAPVKAEIGEIVDELAEMLFAGGKVADRAQGAGLYQRLTILEEQFPGACVLMHKRGLLPPAFQQLWQHPVLMSAAEQMVGPDIVGHPVWNLRCKVPDNEEATVPWHQDAGYLHSSSWTTLQATAWIPLLDANIHNGCMQVVRGGHRAGKVAKHTCCAGDTWYIDLDLDAAESELGISMKDDVVTCEVPEGSVLFLNNLIPHRSLQNYSQDIRWSLDLRWQATTGDAGFYDLKDPIEMKRSNDPDFKADWDSWANVNRTELQQDVDEADPFDTVIAGPWMGNWEMTNHNKHTAGFTSDSSTWEKA